MYAATISPEGHEAEFRDLARRAIAANLPPQSLAFVSPDQPSLLPPLPEEVPQAEEISVPRAFSLLLKDAICHRAGDRFALSYDVLWRILHGERHLATRAADPAVARLMDYAHNVRRDIHKMHAFLRFRESSVDGVAVYTAWFEPRHFILRRAAPFFVDRFTGMNWLIATPIGTALWANKTLLFGPPGAKPPAPNDPVLDEMWLAYYRSTFNPARLRVSAMTKEMPKYYWSNLPETSLVAELVSGAGARVSAMEKQCVEEQPPFASRLASRGRPSLGAELAPIAQLRVEASSCTRCPLHAAATQTVFGEGPDDAQLVFVGEQPGDQEDIAGRPFVGPAGQVFDQALIAAGISRDSVYVTNAVKHFKYVPRGKRRIHAKPNAGEIERCKWWIERELAVIAPRLVVALGGTAAQSLAGRPVAVMRERGPAMFGARPGFVTIHPSFLLRIPDTRARALEYDKFVADLAQVRQMIERPSVTAHAVS